MTNHLHSAMKTAGFDQWQTGGGCMAWGKKSADEKYYALVCSEDNTLGDDDTTSWLVGIYESDSALDGDCQSVADLDEAIGVAVRMLAVPENFFA